MPVVLPRGGLGTVPRLLKFKMMAGTVPLWSESEVDLSIGEVTIRVSLVHAIEFNSNGHI